ncbi:MFS transporter [Trueperella sp. LYQ141]|uniref:MFS transporter n=1 Tax=Trueperella sp. LYQ141 TaxID=3391058 RepID=UPI0039839F26
MRKAYYAWLLADTSTQLGSAIRAFALPVLVVIADGSNTRAGTLSAISSFIIAAVSLIGGVIIDRYDRRILLLLSCAISLMIFGGSIVWLSFNRLTWMFLMVVAVLSALRGGMLGQTSNVLLRDVVEDEKLPRAMSINEGRDASIEIAAGPISGFLITLGAIVPFIVEFVLNALAFAATLFLPSTKTKTAEGANDEESPTPSEQEIDNAARGLQTKERRNLIVAMYRGLANTVGEA